MKTNGKLAEYFGRILDNSFNEIYVFDANGLNFIQMNFGARKNLGYSKDELTCLTPLDLKPEYTRETFEELIKSLRLKQKPSIIFETAHKRKDGTLYPVEVRLQLMHDESPPVFVAIIRDMTDIKKMEEQETKLLSIIENTFDAVVALSVDGIIETWNPAAERIFGYKPEEIIGKNIQILIPSNKKEEAAKLFETLKNNGEVSSVETTRLKKDGNEIHISITLSPIKDEGGKLIGISGISRDISDFKKAAEELCLSEERFRTMFEEAPLGIGLIDSLTGRIYEFNQQYMEIVGRTREELTTVDWMSITHPDDVQEDLDNMSDLNAGKICGFNMNKRFVLPDGSIVWVNLTIAPITVTDKSSPRHLAMIEDITERKRAEEELKEKEHHFRLFLLSTADCFWNWDMVAGTVERSSGFERVFGYKKQEILSGIEWWGARIHPDDKKRVWKTFETAVAGEQSTCLYEYRFRCRDDSYAIVADHVCLIRDATGKVVRSLGAMRDITNRKKMEKNIQRHQNHLEELVRQRTEELTAITKNLEVRITERTHELEAKNLALKEILSQIEIEKKQITDSVTSNSERLLLPLISKLRKKDTNGNKKIYDLLEKNLKELTSEFGGKVLGGLIKLSPKELEICNLIKNGFESKEISSFLNISPKTVDTHRRNVRHKLGIANKEINLTSYLNSI